MTVVVTHSTPSDATFSAQGATAWDANHTLSGVGTMAEQNANNVAITGGAISGVTLPASNITGTLGVTNGGTGVTTSTGSGSNVLNTSPTLTTPAITGGTIDNTVIGGTTPAAGTFTTLTSSGTATLSNGSTTYVTVTGDASYPMIKATGGTNTPLVLSPLGTGALQAQKTDSTATGGNARGANAVDWQTVRASAGQVASGTYSVIAGGTTNTTSGFGGFIGSGFNNTNSAASYGFLGCGTVNTVSGNRAVVVGGSTNTAAGLYNFIGGGFTNSGTANAAVTTQSGTMNATTAVTLSGSNASIKVGQYITGTSIAADTYVAAISGTSLTLSQVASGSSTSTLSFYTPHGVVVGGGNNQATGSYSFIGGGGDAGTSGNRNVASGAWSFIGGGSANTASGQGAVVVGGGQYGGAAAGNTASNTSSVVIGGHGNNSSGYGNTILGGVSNTGNGQLSISSGSYANNRSITGVFTFAANPIANGSGFSQSGLYVLGKQTTDATATVLCTDQNAASTNNQVILPNNSAYFFRGEVVSGVTGGGDTKGWTIEGVIKRGAGVGTTTLVGTPTVTSMYADLGAATWALAVTADTTNGGLRVTFTGQASTTIRTVCQIRTTEMTY
jgi:hypothetical protein